MRITPLVLTGALVAAGFAGDATAAPKKRKPITHSYQATAPLPDPSNYADETYSVCAQNVPQSFHTHEFKAPAPGKLKVTLSNFIGDWDLLLLDPKGTEVGAGVASDLGTPGSSVAEVTSVKVRKAGTYKIIACNWAGGSTGDVKYTFEFA